MMYPKKLIQPQWLNRQTGAVLVMALVLLTVLTLIGVASMSGSSMQMRVASNMQQHNIAFQGAQSRIAYAISLGRTDASGNPNPIDFTIYIKDPTDPTTWPVQTCDPTTDNCPDGTDWSATANIVYKGCSIGFGNSLQAGKSIAVRTFEVQATAQATTGIARSVQYQGVLGTVKDCGT